MSKRNKREDVLYLTLIDFFLQMLFLVMIALLAYIYVQQKYEAEYKRWEALAKAFGTNSVTELLDRLTTLAPIIKDMPPEEVDKSIKISKEGQAKPPCAYFEDGKKTPKSVAIFASNNTSIQLISWEPEFLALAQEVGQNNLTKGTSWSLRKFTSVWSGVVLKHPMCRYTVNLKEGSQLTKPRDTVQGVFYTRIRR